MRPVSGFERPWIQWTFVAIGLLLVGIAAAEAIAIRRAREATEEVRAAEMNARLDRQQFELQLAHERSTREALAIEVARLRGTASQHAEPPTLTLTPLVKRGPTPPEATVDQPPAQLPIQLRLILARTPPPGMKDATITLRSWSTGQTLWSRSGLAVATVDARPTVTALITGDALTAGAYELLLTAKDPAGQPVALATYEVTVAPHGG
jgi:hypothetical protein